MLYKTHPNKFKIFVGIATIVDRDEACMKEKSTKIQEEVSKDGGLNSKTPASTLQKQSTVALNITIEVFSSLIDKCLSTLEYVQKKDFNVEYTGQNSTYASFDIQVHCIQ